MRESVLLVDIQFTDTILGRGEIVERIPASHCPDRAVTACHARGWSAYDEACGAAGEPTIIRDQTGRYRVVSSDQLGPA